MVSNGAKKYFKIHQSIKVTILIINFAAVLNEIPIGDIRILLNAHIAE